MKITREQLLKIIKEEYATVHELGPATGHEEGTKALDTIKELGDNLIGLAEEMRNMPSHVRAQEMAGYTESVGKELLEAHAELSSGTVNESVDPFMIRYIEIIKEKLEKGKEEQLIDPQLADELLSMVAGIEGTSEMRKPE